MCPRAPDAILNDFMKFAIAEAHTHYLSFLSVCASAGPRAGRRGTLHAESRRFLCISAPRDWSVDAIGIYCALSALSHLRLSRSRANALLCALHVESIHKFTQVHRVCRASLWKRMCLKCTQIQATHSHMYKRPAIYSHLYFSAQSRESILPAAHSACTAVRAVQYMLEGKRDVKERLSARQIILPRAERVSQCEFREFLVFYTNVDSSDLYATPTTCG